MLAIIGLTPASGSITGGTNVTISLDTPIEDNSVVGCMFSGTPGIVTAWISTSIHTEITCLSPPQVNATNTLVTVLGNGQTFSCNSVPFMYYDCAVYTTCETCLDPLRSECRYCALTSQCIDKG